MFSTVSGYRLSKSLRKLSYLISKSRTFNSLPRTSAIHNACYFWTNQIRLFSCTRCLQKINNNKDLLMYDLEISDDSGLDTEDDILKNEEIYSQLFRIPGSGHNVFVIQPKIKFYKRKNFNTTSELQLAEAVTLAETLPGWKVVGQHILGCTNPGQNLVFNSGNFATLKSLIVKNTPPVTAVLFGCNLLSGAQHTELEKELRLSVYDRYSIVLQIFLQHARTKEAKLQVALAEIPYLRTRLRHFNDTYHNREHEEMKNIGGSGESFIQRRRTILNDREKKIQKQLEKLRKRRNLLRQARQKQAFPVVAVVGYTNAGKTSLIKILTNDEKMEPKDQLFATLDVTAHATTSLGFQKTIYMDTVGFISDIPTALIQSFSATLEDIGLSDLIIHIRDMSHPDTFSQKETVLETLKGLNLSQKLMDTLLEVGNKIDLLETIPPESDDLMLISATKATGIAELRAVIEERLTENTGQLIATLRVPTGGDASSWLYKMAGLRSIQPDPDDFNFSLMNVVLTSALMAKFKSQFGNLEYIVNAE